MSDPYLKQVWVSYNGPPVQENFKLVINDYHKPKGGLWTSTYKEDIISDWVDWMVAEDYHKGDDIYLLDVLSDSNVLHVHTIEEVLSLPVTQVKHPNGICEFIIDFEMLSRKYDGIHIVDPKGMSWKYHGPDRWWNIFNMQIGTWDVESTFWFRWKFENVQYFGKVPYKERCEDGR